MGGGRGTGLPPADTSSCREPARDGEMPPEGDVWFEAHGSDGGPLGESWPDGGVLRGSGPLRG